MEDNKEKNKEEVQEDLKIADKTNFKDLYVIKDVRGIFISRGMPNKSNLINMILWETILQPQVTSKTAQVSSLISLDSLRFYTTDKKNITVPKLDKDGKVILKKKSGEIKEKDFKNFETEKKEINVVLTIKDIFNNLNDYENTLADELTIEDFDLSNKETMSSLMDIAVPNFDKDKFKNYHLKKVIKYYTWFKEALNEFNEFGKENKK